MACSGSSQQGQLQGPSSASFRVRWRPARAPMRKLHAVEEAGVGRVRVAGFSASLDGFGAGPEQSLEDPLGKRGTELHSWMFGTRMFRTMIGKDGGSDGVDQTYAHRSMDGFGAFILGRNMFGPIRGPW